MVNHSCINGTLAGTDKYSSPVPIIGLYIAAASVVCFLLMLYDIVVAYIKRYNWIPCKLFKLNSVTLTLIGVVIKLTGDLTTSMPSALDQLSKLVGATSLCIYMCCVFPSVGDMKDSSNIFALSILVITAFVNMCIQISTGVIVLFIPEHISILSLMLLLLLITWNYVLTTKFKIKRNIEEHRSRFVNSSQGSFMRRLESAFKSAFLSNPQKVVCHSPQCGIVGDLSLISFAIVLQAAIRTVVLKKEVLCKGKSSDYSWSMEAIVATQLATVTIGTFTSYARRCAMTYHMLFVEICVQKPIEEPYFSNPIWESKISFFLVVTHVIYVAIVFVNYWLLSQPILAFYWLKSRMSCLFHDTQDLFWMSRKADSEMEKLKETSKRKSNNLCEILKEILPPPQSPNPPRYQGPRPREGALRARLLPLVVLVRIVQVAIKPENLSRNIILSFREAFEALHFVDKHVHNTSPEDTKETKLAKAVWMARDFNHLLSDTSRRSNASSLERAFHVMDEIHGEMRHYTQDPILEVIEEIRSMVTLRGRESFSSVEELSFFMEDLYANLLDIMLAQLPVAIFTAISLCPADKYEKRVRKSIEQLYKFESWEGVARWRYPRIVDYRLPKLQNFVDLGYREVPNTEDVAAGSQTNIC